MLKKCFFEASHRNNERPSMACYILKVAKLSSEKKRYGCLACY